MCVVYIIIIVMFLALSLNRRHEKVSITEACFPYFEFVIWTLGVISKSFGNYWNYFLSKCGNNTILCYLAHAHCVLVPGRVDDQAAEAELVVFWWFCKPRANAFGLKSSSVLHMQCIESMVPLHRSLLAVIWLPNDFCILIVNFLCYACNFPWGGVKLDHQNDLWNGNLFEGSY